MVFPSHHRAAGAALSSPLSRLHSPVVSHLTTERLVLSGGPLQSPQSATLPRGVPSHHRAAGAVWRPSPVPSVGYTPRGVPISPQSGWCCLAALSSPLSRLHSPVVFPSHHRAAGAVWRPSPVPSVGYTPRGVPSPHRAAGAVWQPSPVPSVGYTPPWCPISPQSGWCCLAALSSPLSRLHSPWCSHLTTERLVLSGGPLQSPQSATLPVVFPSHHRAAGVVWRPSPVPSVGYTPPWCSHLTTERLVLSGGSLQSPQSATLPMVSPSHHRAAGAVWRPSPVPSVGYTPPWCPHLTTERLVLSGGPLQSPQSATLPVVSPSHHRAAGAVWRPSPVPSVGYTPPWCSHLTTERLVLPSPVPSVGYTPPWCPHLTTERLVLFGGPLQYPQSATLPRGVPISTQSGWCCPLQSPQSATLPRGVPSHHRAAGAVWRPSPVPSVGYIQASRPGRSCRSRGAVH